MTAAKAVTHLAANPLSLSPTHLVVHLKVPVVDVDVIELEVVHDISQQVRHLDGSVVLLRAPSLY